MANADGVAGLQAVRRAGGLALVQDPATAGSTFMPQAAIDAGAADEVLTPEQIAGRLLDLCHRAPSCAP